MQTQVSIPHHDYPPAIRETVEARLSNLDRYYDRIVSLRAVLARDRDDHRVELVANVGHGITLVVDAREEGLTSALDEAVQRMRTVLARHKERLVERHRQPHRGEA